MILVMMLIGAGLVYLLLEYVYRRIWNKNLQAKIAFSSDHAVVGETVELVEVVTNRKWMPLPYVHLKFQTDRELLFEDGSENSKTSDKTYRNDIFSLLMYQRITRKIPLFCSKRGVYTIRKFEIVSTGMFMDELLVAEQISNTELVVYPETAEASLPEVAFSKLMGTIEKNKYLYEDPFVFRGIRDYTTTDTMNSINWKAAARTGTLMVNQYNETICQEICILLNVESEGMLRRDDLSEASISIAAGLSQMLIERGVSVSIVSNGADYFSKEPVCTESASGFSHMRTINVALARIDLATEMTDFKQVIERLVKPEAYSRNVIYVMISQNTRKDLQSAFDVLTKQRSDCMWVIPINKGDEEKALGGCHAYPVIYEVARGEKVRAW